MNALRIVPALVALSSLVAGCGGSSGRDLFHGGELPASNFTPTYRILPGAAPQLNTPFGYLIAANVGGSYRVAWTGSASGAPRHFTGSMWTPGNFTSVAPGCVDASCSLESDDFVSTVKVVAGGSRIDWDTFADAGLDGVDVIVDTEPVYFDFFVDGARLPMNVAFAATDNGGVSSPAGQLPFSLVSN